MRALGTNLSQLHRFPFAEALTIGGLSVMIGGRGRHLSGSSGN